MIILKNYMEEVVLNLMDDILKDMDLCKCDKCKMDIAAIALNNLPVKYVASEKGELYSKLHILKKQFEVDAITEILKAAALVNESPHH
ncbi:late competence development ComFB family protein [Tissierella sp. Yu-01]|uniref:late competence development ComFB family protein n=1 Tax=Tissierella sp. Yu-01 TaxID=3035694 RepID=UPI00240DC36E|nr:late competence development ComFB family protein [Tissierella sp. Yu-01]WFA08055.1 late competence development ComFB family protein [Tissierella sp. Yu-01]